MTEFNNLQAVTAPSADDETLVVRNGEPYRGSIGTLLSLSVNAAVSVFEIRLPSGENGGTFEPQENWIFRPFNWQSSNSLGTISDGRIAVPAGKYFVFGHATGMEAQSQRARIRAAEAGQEIYSLTGYSSHYSLFVPFMGVMTLPDADELLLEQWCSKRTPKPWGFGYRSGVEPEVYASVLIMKLS